MTARKFTHTRFSIMPDWIIDALAPEHRAYAAIVWHVMWKHADNETLELYPSRGTIGKLAGCSDTTVKRTVNRLEAIGALERVGQRRTRHGGWSSQVYMMHLDQPGGPR